MGTLLAIARREKSRDPMEVLDRARMTLESGVQSDLRGKPGRRQVTVLTQESWSAACEKVGQDLPWTTRRANLLIEGVNLQETTGARIHIGEAILEVTGETKPCSLMESYCDGLHDALVPDWRGGVVCRVIQGGTIQPDDAVEVIPAQAQSQ